MLTVATVLDRLGLDLLIMIMRGRIEGDLQREVFDALVANGEASQFNDTLVDVAQAAVDRITLAINAATRLINGYVTKRHPNGLTDEQISDSPLPDIALVLVTHELMVNTDEDTRINYKHAMNQLRDIANGTLSLGLTDPVKSTETAIVVGGGGSRFDWGAFGR